jgi:hypothetical protein
MRQTSAPERTLSSPNVDLEVSHKDTTLQTTTDF